MMLLPRFVFVTMFFALVACGGGSGSKENNPPSGGGGSSENSAQTSSQQSSATSLKTMTRHTAPVMAGAFIDAFNYVIDLPYDVYDELHLYQTIKDSNNYLDCDQGKLRLKISNNGQRIEQHYEKCKSDGSEISGERTISITNINQLTGATVEYTLKNLNIKFDDQSTPEQTWNGTTAYIGDTYFNEDSDSIFEAYVNLTIDDARDGRLTVKNLHITQDYNRKYTATDFNKSFSYLKSISGEIVVNDIHGTQIELHEEKVVIKDSNNASISIANPSEFYNSLVTLAWDANNDSISDASVALPIAPWLTETEEFSVSDMIAKGEHTISFSPHSYAHANLIYEGTQLYMGRGNTIDVYLASEFIHSSASLLHYELNGKISDANEWEQLEAGHFRLKFGANVEDKNYDLAFTAVDTEGNRSNPVNAKIYVGTDTDADILPDFIDTDDDNDRYPDSSDAFPLDKMESHDSDGDNIGNNSDPDYGSSIEEGRLWFLDKNGILFYKPIYGTNFIEGRNIKYSKRWSTKTGIFLPHLEITNDMRGDGVYDTTKNRFYYSDEAISYFDLNTLEDKLFLPKKENAPFAERIFIKFITENHVVVSYTVTIFENIVSYDNNANLISSISGTDDRGSITVLPPSLAAVCRPSITTDTAGTLHQLSSLTGSPTNFCFVTGPKVSLDGKYVFKTSGNIGNQFDGISGIYTIDGTLVSELSATRVYWLSSGMLDVSGEGVTLYNTQGIKLNQFNFNPGEILLDTVNNDDEIVFSLRLPSGKIRILSLDSNLNVISGNE